MDNDCIRSDINVLEKMVGWYDKRGHGHHQKEALKTAINILKSLVNVKMPEKKGDEGCGIGTYYRQGYNQAIDDCKLVLLKLKLIGKED